MSRNTAIVVMFAIFCALVAAVSIFGDRPTRDEKIAAACVKTGGEWRPVFGKYPCVRHVPMPSLFSDAL